MAFIDYYKILGVSKDIPQDRIRAAYKKRTKQFHPDLHPDDPKAKAKFQALNEAYNVLGDPDKRSKYDRYGEHWETAGSYGGAGAGGWGDRAGGGNSFEGFDFSQFGGGGGFSSFFEELFGRGGARSSSRQSASYASDVNTNMNATVDVDMYTALLGGEIILQTQQSKMKLKIKPGTQSGTKVRVRGKGYDRGDGTFGDLIITYNVKLPATLNERQKELLRQMQSAG